MIDGPALSGAADGAIGVEKSSRTTARAGGRSPAQADDVYSATIDKMMIAVIRQYWEFICRSVESVVFDRLRTEMSFDPNIHRTQHFANPAHISAHQDENWNVPKRNPPTTSDFILTGLIVGVFGLIALANLLIQ